VLKTELDNAVHAVDRNLERHKTDYGKLEVEIKKLQGSNTAMEHELCSMYRKCSILQKKANQNSDNTHVPVSQLELLRSELLDMQLDFDNTLAQFAKGSLVGLAKHEDQLLIA